MKKIKTNQGHTIPIVLVIIIVLTIMTSSIVYAVSVSTKKTSKDVIEYTNKLQIENNMYQLLNEVVNGNFTLSTQVYKDDNENITFDISLVEDTKYTFNVSNDSSYKLNATIIFSSEYDSYDILKWGFIKE